MSLKAFHIVFITLSALLSAALAFWGLDNYKTLHETSGLVLGVVGLVSLLLLVPYFIWFRRKMKRLTLGLGAAILILLTLSEPAGACAVCYGDPASPLSTGVKMGIISLAGMVYFLLAGIVIFVISCIRRAKKIQAPSPPAFTE